MAKFKKKKSKPTPEPPKDTEPVQDKPEIQEQPDMPASPDPEPQNDVQKSEKDRKLNTLFWLRVALAVIAGASATFIFEDIQGEDRRWASIGFMIIVFFGTIIIAKNMKMQLPSSDRKKIVTQAIGSYIFLYLFTWIVTHTIIHSSTPTGLGI